jgi:NAD(P)-dependent dehydrogenase (short-subunit alcohol dehydrogenase family)
MTLTTNSHTAVVVGAGGELGRAVALRLADAGATVVAVDRSEAGLAALPERIRREVADATDPTVAKPLIDRIAGEIGAPDILVNTLGAYGVGDALSATSDDLELMMNVNLGPALWLTQAVAPHMVESGAGSILHVAARPAIEPTPGLAAYSASKAALVQIVRVLDVELRPKGIRVNAVAPQLIATERNKTLVPPEFLAHAVSPDAIAAVIVFLVSDVAEPISGAIVPTYGA